ncbi:hypothetical protein SAMN05428958_1293 [Pantoea sesami]|nr:hypothetical protein SAMN05428958_1293 [Pantoea sesami]
MKSYLNRTIRLLILKPFFYHNQLKYSKLFFTSSYFFYYTM